MRNATVVFTACFVFWFLLSAHFAPLDIAMATIAAAGVALLNRDIELLSGILRFAPRLIGYTPWLLKEIVLANWQVLKIVVDPKLPIDPVVVRFTPALTTDLALTTLANSITLTPGTITLDLEGTEFTVHALTSAGGADIIGGGMARRVGQVFGDPARDGP